jgi:DNA-binding NtrC family response regulator
MRVLVADNDDSVLMAIELLLRREKMQPSLARSPAEVLAAMKKDTFDAVLLDLNYQRDTTSGSEGFALLDELRKHHPRVPVVVMTGHDTPETRARAVQLGAKVYLRKPIDDEALLAAIGDAIGGGAT